MEFFLATKQNGINGMFDGLLGLCRNETGYTLGPLFMSQLKSQGVIQNNVMAFFLTNVTNQSVAEFGGYSTKYMRNPKVPPVYVKAQNSPYWLMKV